VPESYTIDLHVNEDTMTFSGTVTVIGKKIGRPSSRLTFHQKGLTITNAVITHKAKNGSTVHDIARINTHNTFDEVRLHTHKQLPAGHYEVSMTFNGTITTPMNGMYPCFYEENGVKKQFIATQFESHHAREVIPCIDEPEAKAIFTLALTTRTGVTAISNTPVVSQTTKGDHMTTSFEPTPKMSTYLLAFVVGDMGYKEAKTKRGVVVRAYATPDNTPHTDFALETAVRCIDFYEAYFGINYPLPKADIIALPDFASGAMENWGCITFREQCMIVDPQNTSVPTKQYVAMVVAHEFAHMWFGNLVTMRWWTDLWLNEGFASWVEYMAVDALFPEWQMWTQFIVDDQQQAMKLDALDNTHPIEVTVKHPDEIRTIFDAISYQKGASVIHQLHARIGAQAFKEGLHLYLTRHAYGNTDTKDLWQALSEASGTNVGEFMHAWTAKPGFPLVHVAKQGDGSIASQKRFYIDPAAQQSDTLWHVPLLTNTNSNDFATHTVHINDAAPLLNKGRSGFYRTTYDTDILEIHSQAVLDDKLEPVDRLGLLSDLFEVSKAGVIPSTDIFALLKSYNKEQNAAVWSAIAGVIGSIKLVFGTDELRAVFKPFIRELAAAEYNRLGWDKKESDTYFDTLQRPTIIGLLAAADHPEVVQKSLDLFAAITHPDDMKNTDERQAPLTSTELRRSIDIDPDLRGVVYSTAARRGGKAEFEKLVRLHNETTLSEEKVTFAAAISDFSEPQQIKGALDMIRSEHVRLQDVGYWIAYSFLNPHARTATWEWLQANWEWLQANLGTDMSFSRMPVYAARVFTTEEFKKEFIAFFEPRLNPTIERSYKQGLEILEWQTAWRKRDYQALLDYLTALQK